MSHRGERTYDQTKEITKVTREEQMKKMEKGGRTKEGRKDLKDRQTERQRERKKKRKKKRKRKDKKKTAQ